MALRAKGFRGFGACQARPHDHDVGVLAHELCHLETFEKKRGLKYAFDGILYWTNVKKRTKEDKDTDRLAIKKGYAKELYYFKKNKRKSKIAKYYLSAEDIKKYAKKIGKWQ